MELLLTTHKATNSDFRIILFPGLTRIFLKIFLKHLEGHILEFFKEYFFQGRRLQIDSIKDFHGIIFQNSHSHNR